MLLSVADALDNVLSHAEVKAAAETSLTNAFALALAENIVSDIDSPPHDKSLVDGYAVRTADFANGQATLTVLEEITAGLVPTKPVIAGHCTRIMTGAPIPFGADAVIMIERTVISEPARSLTTVPSPLSPGGRGAGGEGDGPTQTVTLSDPPLRPQQNILPRAKSLRRGDTVLSCGTILHPAEIGLLAEVGRTQVQVIPPVRVAILSTGNELVPADLTPAAGQIRNSNTPLLSACVARVGAVPIELGIARDTVEDLRRAIQLGLESDILLISGGVSAGVLDLVPSVLAELGVEQVFHKVSLKPGKPLWFGKAKSASQASAAKSELPSASNSALRTFAPLVFGLPGNPISSLVCFELFVKPAIAKISGRPAAATYELQPASLTKEFTHRGDRPTYFPGVLQTSSAGAQVSPNNWQGSADLRGFVGANCLIAFPAGNRKYEVGESVDVLTM